MNTDREAWIYTKLYFGQHAERADSFIVALGQLLDEAEPVARWFFIRYVDDGGFHLRLRVAPAAGQFDAAAAFIRIEVAALFNQMYSFVPSTYRPMVSLPDYLRAEPPVTGAALRMVEDVYVPETEKYGTGRALQAAERLFCLSSAIAWQVLDLEEAGALSRKSIAPWLMYETNDALPSFAAPDYWRDYGLYWLGGPGTAASDWRRRFKAKADDLADCGETVLEDLPASGRRLVDRWRDSLRAAASDFVAADGRSRHDVISLNLAHLMMNRLGIATLEEAFLATLLENQLAAVA